MTMNLYNYFFPFSCRDSSGSSDDSGDLSGLPKRVTSRSVNHRRPSLANSDTSKNAIEKVLSK